MWSAVDGMAGQCFLQVLVPRYDEARELSLPTCRNELRPSLQAALQMLQQDIETTMLPIAVERIQRSRTKANGGDTNGGGFV